MICSKRVFNYYRYDSVDRLVAFEGPDSLTNQRFYCGTALSNEVRGAALRSHVRVGSHLLGVRAQEGASVLALLGTEQQGSVVQVLDESGQHRLAYTPHGEGADASLPGFNGEQPDPLTGNYSLGNGYRAYNPTLMRFHSPDNLSPFGGGGLSAYSYCLGDPINFTDPTGHLSWQAGLGIGLGVLGLAYGGFALASGALAASTGVSAASAAMMVAGAAGIGAVGTGVAQAVDPGSAAAGTLGWISLGLGAASLIAGLAANHHSPANAQQPSRVSGLVPYSLERNGVLQAAARTEAANALAFIPSMSTTANFQAVMGLPNIARSIVHYSLSNDLIALSDTSTALRQAVFENLRPISRYLGNASNERDLAGNEQQIYAANLISAGAFRGMMPAQLSRAGINPRYIPIMERNGYIVERAAQHRQRAREAARIRERVLQERYSWQLMRRQ